MKCWEVSSYTSKCEKCHYTLRSVWASHENSKNQLMKCWEVSIYTLRSVRSVVIHFEVYELLIRIQEYINESLRSVIIHFEVLRSVIIHFEVYELLIRIQEYINESLRSVIIHFEVLRSVKIHFEVYELLMGTHHVQCRPLLHLGSTITTLHTLIPTYIHF